MCNLWNGPDVALTAGDQIADLCNFSWTPSTQPLLLIRPGLVVFSTKVQFRGLPRALGIPGVKKTRVSKNWHKH